MVGLDDVVELLHLPEFGLGGTLAGLLRLPDGLAVASRLAGVDNDGPLLAPAQRLAREPLGGIGIAGLRQEEVDGVATAVDRAYRYARFPLTLMQVSSTRQDRARLRGRYCRRSRFSVSGAQA